MLTIFRDSSECIPHSVTTNFDISPLFHLLEQFLRGCLCGKVANMKLHVKL